LNTAELGAATLDAPADADADAESEGDESYDCDGAVFDRSRLVADGSEVVEMSRSSRTRLGLPSAPSSAMN
jgi:hypothetical protein